MRSGRVRGDRRRSLTAAVVAVALLAALAVGADRVAAWVTSRGVVAAVTAEGDDITGAHVDIHGFPFVTQLAAGRLGHVTGGFGAGTFGGYRVTDVHLDATGLQPRAPWRVEQAKVDGLVTFATVAGLISDQLGTDASVAPATGQPGALSLSLRVAGVELGVVVVPTVVDASTVGVKVTGLVLGGITVGAGSVPGGLGAQLDALHIPVDLPDGVALREVGVESGGLRLGAQAGDVALADLVR